jgi:hypothetical protein
MCVCVCMCMCMCMCVCVCVCVVCVCIIWQRTLVLSPIPPAPWPSSCVAYPLLCKVLNTQREETGVAEEARGSGGGDVRETPKIPVSTSSILLCFSKLFLDVRETPKIPVSDHLSNTHTHTQICIYIRKWCRDESCFTLSFPLASRPYCCYPARSPLLAQQVLELVNVRAAATGALNTPRCVCVCVCVCVRARARVCRRAEYGTEPRTQFE